MEDAAGIRETVEGMIGGGRFDEAIALLQNSGAGKTRDEELAILYVRALEEAGRRERAMQVCHGVIQWKPDSWRAHHLLGRMMLLEGKAERALGALQTAVRLAPESAVVHDTLAQALWRLGRKGEALRAAARAAELAPAQVETRLLLGVWRMESGDALGGLRDFQAAAAMAPDSGRAWRLLGNALAVMGRWEEAIAALRRAVAAEPGSSAAQYELGRALEVQERHAEALERFAAQAALEPGRAEPRYRMGECLRVLGKWEEAVGAFDEAILRDPGHILAHGGRALALLALGRFKEGWADYEWRWKAESFPMKKPRIGVPEWRGEDLAGKRIAVYAEQGFGDTIMLARYVRLLAARGAKVVLHVSAALVGLLGGIEGAEEVLVSGGQPGEKVDYWAGMFSLPGFLGTEVGTIPAEVPYVGADAGRVEYWRGRLAGLGGVRVGICWVGNPRFWRNASRSVPLSVCAPLLEIPGVSWVGLVKEVPAAEKKLLAGLHIFDISGELADFGETAAVIENVDLVISVDTAVAHLAGALAKKVWLMLPLVAEWRWLAAREDSPWYPTMRLFRQRTPGDWAGVVARISDELRRLALRGNARPSA